MSGCLLIVYIFLKSRVFSVLDLYYPQRDFNILFRFDIHIICIRTRYFLNSHLNIFSISSVFNLLVVMCLSAFIDFHCILYF